MLKSNLCNQDHELQMQSIYRNDLQKLQLKFSLQSRYSLFTANQARL